MKCYIKVIVALGPSINYVGVGGGQASYTFLLRITCKKGGGGPDSP